MNRDVEIFSKGVYILTEEVNKLLMQSTAQQAIASLAYLAALHIWNRDNEQAETACEIYKMWFEKTSEKIIHARAQPANDAS